MASNKSSPLNPRPKVILIDYGMGNLSSVRNSFSYIGCEVIITGDVNEIARANYLVLPGVGSFRRGMERINELGLAPSIKEAVISRRSKILGICLGMQMLAMDSTEDGYTEGLGLIPHHVDLLSQPHTKSVKIPHIGFNEVTHGENSILFSGVPNNSDFYFDHSYCITSNFLNGDIATCNYSQNFLAAYEDSNIYATQFHPEKSQGYGLRLLSNFILGKAC
ncbi:MAG: imidazole glycerol phosphate synthase subunit HisH [Polynucleobacter sp.]|nr:imidazole glycerol phosphate synthase subunit HisH [Polynucleobacter sp.]